MRSQWGYSVSFIVRLIKPFSYDVWSVWLRCLEKELINSSRILKDMREAYRTFSMDEKADKTHNSLYG